MLPPAQQETRLQPTRPSSPFNHAYPHSGLENRTSKCGAADVTPLCSRLFDLPAYPLG